MNIGFDAKRAFWNQTGLGNYARFILQGLAEFFPENQYYFYSPSLKVQTAPDFLSPSSHLHKIDLGRGWNGTFHRVANMSPYFKRDRLDIYHGLSNELPYFGKSQNTKQVVSIHDLLFLRYPSFYPLLDRTIYKAKTLHACSTSDLILAISEQTKSDLITFLKVPEKKIKVHYQACHPQFALPHSELEIKRVKDKYGLTKPYVVQIGTLEERKNALFTLKAYAASTIKEEFDVAFVGKETNYCNSLHQFVKDTKLTGHVHFIYQSDFVDFPLLYKGASLSVYPSLFEGFGIPILEALTVGVPIISSTGGCFHEVGGDAALYVNPTSVEEMTSSMEKILSDPFSRNEMVKKGFHQAAKFAPKRLIGELHQLYQHI